MIELAGMVCYFILWTLMLYWTHRLAHIIPWLRRLHRAHHQVEYRGEMEFHWHHLLGFWNDWRATADQWLTEIIPTLAFIAVFPSAWPLAILYYIDGVALGEGVWDHNPRIRIPLLAAGRYHLEHHKNPGVNFDGYTPLWDTVFKTRAARKSGLAIRG